MIHPLKQVLISTLSAIGAVISTKLLWGLFEIQNDDNASCYLKTALKISAFQIKVHMK